MSEPRRVEHLVHGQDGPVIIITSRVANYLCRHAGLDRYRREHRGEDPEVDNALLGLAVLAASWSQAATGTRETARPELDPSLQWLSTSQAAGIAQIGDRGIRKAIEAGHLKAHRIGTRYRINRIDLEHYRASQRRTS